MFFFLDLTNQMNLMLAASRTALNHQTDLCQGTSSVWKVDQELEESDIRVTRPWSKKSSMPFAILPTTNFQWRFWAGWPSHTILVRLHRHGAELKSCGAERPGVSWRFRSMLHFWILNSSTWASLASSASSAQLLFYQSFVLQCHSHQHRCVPEKTSGKRLGAGQRWLGLADAEKSQTFELLTREPV